MARSRLYRSQCLQLNHFVGRLLTRSTRSTCILWEKRTEIKNEIVKMYPFTPLRPQQFRKFSSRIWRFFHKFSKNIAKMLQFSCRFVLKLDWCSITKKKWGRKEKKSKEARRRSRVTFEETYIWREYKLGLRQRKLRISDRTLLAGAGCAGRPSRRLG